MAGPMSSSNQFTLACSSQGESRLSWLSRATPLNCLSLLLRRLAQDSDVLRFGNVNLFGNRSLPQTGLRLRALPPSERCCATIKPNFAFDPVFHGIQRFE